MCAAAENTQMGKIAPKITMPAANASISRTGQAGAGLLEQRSAASARKASSLRASAILTRTAVRCAAVKRRTSAHEALTHRLEMNP
jgi:hypothetical protein